MQAEVHFAPDRSLKTIVPFVFLAHLLLIIAISSFSTGQPLPIPVKRMVVTTIKLQPVKPSRPPPAKAVAKAEPVAPSKAVAKVDPVEPAKAEEEVVAMSELPEPAPVKDEVVAQVSAPAPEPAPEPEVIKPKEEKPATKKGVKQETAAKPKAPSKKAAAKPKKVESKKVAQAPKKAPAKKPAKAAAKKVTAPPKPAQEKNVSNPAADAKKQKQIALLKQAKEKMGQVDLNLGGLIASNTSGIGSTATPSAIESLHIDTVYIESAETLNSKEVAYRDELAGRLKRLLTLPEFGEVKLKLTLDRSGQVVSVKILAAQSSANKTYIEKTLPTLKMPAFGSKFGTAPTNAFTITMSNE